jgi:hypothetical protein
MVAGLHNLQQKDTAYLKRFISFLFNLFRVIGGGGWSLIFRFFKMSNLQIGAFSSQFKQIPLGIPIFGWFLPLHFHGF